MYHYFAKTVHPRLNDKGTSERAAMLNALLTRPGGRWVAFQAIIAGCDHELVGPWLGKVKALVFMIIGGSDPAGRIRHKRMGLELFGC